MSDVLELPLSDKGFPKTPSTAWLYADILQRINGVLMALNAATNEPTGDPRLHVDAVPLRLGVLDIPVWIAEPAIEGKEEFVGWIHQIDADAFVFVPASAVKA